MRSSREIVAEAWHLTIEHRSRLFRLGFVPAFFSILATAIYVYYQVQAFRYSPIFSEGDEHFQIEFALRMFDFITQSTVVLIVSLLAIITLLIGWFFAPMLCRAAITHLVAQAWRGEKVEHGFSSALFHFFPIFEIALLKRGLAPLSFITEIAFIARNLTGGLRLLSPLLLFFAAIGGIFLFFSLFTNQAIMLRDQGFAASISTSFKTVIQNFSQTLRILILFLLVELRVVVNVLIVLFLPIALAGLTGLFAGMVSDTVGMVIAIVFFLILIFLAAYLTGILFVFSEAMWTVAFLHFHQEETSESPLATPTDRPLLQPEQTSYQIHSFSPDGSRHEPALPDRHPSFPSQQHS